MERRKLPSWQRDGLVVIAIIIVAVVLFHVAAYAITHARQVSQQQVCTANLKTLGEACKMYQQDWHDVLVPYGAPFAWPPEGTFWIGLLDPYLKAILPPDEQRRVGKLLKCPGFPEEKRCFCYDRDYGINTECGGWLPRKKPVVVSTKSVKYPQSTIMIAEVKWLAQGGSIWAARPSGLIRGDPTCHMFATWHQRKGNVLWIDGHVSSMTLEQYNMRDKGPYDGNIWLRLEGPKPPVP